MGKQKVKKHRKRKAPSAGLRNVHDVELEDDEVGDVEAHFNTDSATDGSSSIQSIIEKLQSSTVEDKELGCSNIAVITEDKDRSIQTLLDNEIVRIVAPLLIDPSFVVRHAAAGALRNLSACGSGNVEVYDAMMKQDVMTPLVALFKQYYEGFTPSRKNKRQKTKEHESRLDTKLDTLVEATHILWNLCEGNTEALKVFNDEHLLTILLQYTNPTSYSSDLVIAVVQCIHTVSEDNPGAIELLGRKEFREIFEKLLNLEPNSSPNNSVINSPTRSPGSDASYNENDVLLIRALAAGVLVNVNPGQLNGTSSAVIGSIVQTLSKSLTNDPSSSVVAVADLWQRTDKEDAVGRVAKRDLDHLLSSQIVALEILTNVCCVEDGSKWDDADSSDGSGEELFNVGDDLMMDCDSAVEESFPLAIPSELQEAIIGAGLGEKVLNKITPLNEEVCLALRKTQKGKSVLKRLCSLQCRALLCLHNLVSCFEVEDLGGTQGMYSVWKQLGQLAFRHTYVCPSDADNPTFCDTPEHTEHLEAVTRAMRGVLQKLAQAKSAIFQDLSPTDVQLMREVAEICPDVSVRTNIINIVGTIGTYLGNLLQEHPTSAAMLKSMGLFLLDLCSRDCELVVISEALDAIFDVFGEDHTDAICREINLLERLKQVLPTLKQKINTQRKQIGDHYPVITTARMNLVRFIKYKTDFQASSSTNGHH